MVPFPHFALPDSIVSQQSRVVALIAIFLECLEPFFIDLLLVTDLVNQCVWNYFLVSLNHSLTCLGHVLIYLLGGTPCAISVFLLLSFLLHLGLYPRLLFLQLLIVNRLEEFCLSLVPLNPDSGLLTLLIHFHNSCINHIDLVVHLMNCHSRQIHFGERHRHLSLGFLLFFWHRQGTTFRHQLAIRAILVQVSPHRRREEPHCRLTSRDYPVQRGSCICCQRALASVQGCDMTFVELRPDLSLRINRHFWR